MKAVFITGTGTGVGKTVVTGCLAGYLRERGFSVATQKWIETGLKDAIAPKGRNVTYAFRTACSPHLAALIEHRKIDKKKIIAGFKSLSGAFDFVVVEGIGGALVPFSEKQFVIDIARELKLPVIVVAENKLGAINYTLLTLEALKKRRLKILGLIFNNLKKEKPWIVQDNPRVIRTLSKCEVLGILPRAKTKKSLKKAFIPVGNKILRSLK